MKATKLQQYTEEIVVSIAFAWTMIKPELLQTMHALALQSVPATVGMAPPAVDTPVTNVDMGMSLRPVRDAEVPYHCCHSDRSGSSNSHFDF